MFMRDVGKGAKLGEVAYLLAIKYELMQFLF